MGYTAEELAMAAGHHQIARAIQASVALIAQQLTACMCDSELMTRSNIGCS